MVVALEEQVAAFAAQLQRAPHQPEFRAAVMQRLEQGALAAGAAAWGDTVLDLAFLPKGARLVNVLTGDPVETDASGRLPLSRAITHFPGALLAYGAPSGASASDPTGEMHGKTSS